MTYIIFRDQQPTRVSLTGTLLQASFTKRPTSYSGTNNLQEYPWLELFSRPVSQKDQHHIQGPTTYKGIPDWNSSPGQFHKKTYTIFRDQQPTRVSLTGTLLQASFTKRPASYSGKNNLQEYPWLELFSMPVSQKDKVKWAQFTISGR